LILWPETTYPASFRTPLSPKELSRDLRLEQFVRDLKIPLLFGGYDRKEQKDFNAFFMLTPEPVDGQDLQIYQKNVLLPFGEYIPFLDENIWTKMLFPNMGFFGQGPGALAYSIKIPKGTGNDGNTFVKVSPIICYEALISNYVIEGARKGSELILNITNDSWFGPYGEPHLHLALVALRSIEVRLPQLRTTNTGISVLILPDGERVNPSPIYVAGNYFYEIPVIKPQKTLMLLWGDWFGLTALVLSVIIILGARICRGRRSAFFMSMRNETMSGVVG
jgi:apolipoprotein N-acyltransferase